MAGGFKSISHIYSRRENGEEVLDILISNNGRVTSTLQNVRPTEISFLKDEDVKVTFNPYWRYAYRLKSNTLSLNDARLAGFPGNFLPVSIRGKTYYIDAGYRANRTLLQGLQLQPSA